MRPGNADIKYPWELGAVPALGDARPGVPCSPATIASRVEIARELDDFVEANPDRHRRQLDLHDGRRASRGQLGDRPRTGARAARALDDAFWTRAYSALFDHGVFIRNNLENTYEVTSNHFLSNLARPAVRSARCSRISTQGAAWTSFARAAIEHEMDVQVLPDGADYESSIPYHRLVAELFLGAARLADYQRRAAVGRLSRSRLRDMVAYLAAVTRPDGLMPQVGDADDGRLHVFEGYGIDVTAGRAASVRSRAGDVRRAGVASRSVATPARGRRRGGGSTPTRGARRRAARRSAPAPIARLFPHAGHRR